MNIKEVKIRKKTENILLFIGHNRRNLIIPTL
jgi:hypothetical protein